MALAHAAQADPRGAVQYVRALARPVHAIFRPRLYAALGVGGSRDDPRPLPIGPVDVLVARGLFLCLSQHARFASDSRRAWPDLHAVLPAHNPVLLPQLAQRAVVPARLLQ